MADLIPQLFPPAEPVIRTLGLYQPYATLMLHGKIETRWVITGKRPPFPIGRYLIYACEKSYTTTEFYAIAGKYAMAGFELFNNDPSITCRGEAIAIGDLVNVREMLPTDSEFAFVEWQPSRLRTLWALEFDNMKRITPFSFTQREGRAQGVKFFKGDKSKIQILL